MVSFTCTIRNIHHEAFVSTRLCTVIPVLIASRRPPLNDSACRQSTPYETNCSCVNVTSDIEKYYFLFMNSMMSKAKGSPANLRVALA